MVARYECAARRFCHRRSAAHTYHLCPCGLRAPTVLTFLVVVRALHVTPEVGNGSEIRCP